MENTYFEKVKTYIDTLNIDISREDPSEHLIVVTDENRGLSEMIIDVEGELLILEQAILSSKMSADFHKRLLEMNRMLVHGAFAIDADSGTMVFRDTLQLANLDLNELEASINALTLAFAEFGDEILEEAKKGGTQ